MDDLTKCLHTFIWEHRMDRLLGSREYRKFSNSILAQIEQIDSYLTKEQRREFHRLLDNINEQNSMEHDYLFQAALDLAKELNELV